MPQRSDVPQRPALKVARDFFLVVVAILAAWTAYGAMGRRIILWVHEPGTSWVADRLMSHRAQTPLVSYLRRADELMLLITFRLMAIVVFVAVLAAARKRPMRAACLAFATITATVIVFAVLEVRPAVASTLHLDAVDYYAYRNIFIADHDLVYRPKPLLHALIAESHDPPEYLANVVGPMPLSDWTTDEEGFRNRHAMSTCDVVLIGDGMINAGPTLADTFGAILEDRLKNRCVANLAISGHGPFQYLETFKRYGIAKQPKLSILAFNEGNDLQEIRKYLDWKSGLSSSYTGGYEVGITNPVSRLTTAASETWTYLRQQSWDIAAKTVFSAVDPDKSVRRLAGNVALIRLPTGAQFPMVFIDREAIDSPHELERSEQWHHLTDLVAAFGRMSKQNGSIPVLMFIPEAEHIYAQYSTHDSGAEWLAIRDQEVASKMNLEMAVTDLSRQLGIRFISLSVPFESAARNGDRLYDSFSVHMTPRATAIAAKYVAETILSSVHPFGSTSAR
jgi:hypothetical protein